MALFRLELRFSLSLIHVKKNIGFLKLKKKGGQVGQGN